MLIRIKSSESEGDICNSEQVGHGLLWDEGTAVAGRGDSRVWRMQGKALARKLSRIAFCPESASVGDSEDCPGMVAGPGGKAGCEESTREDKLC